MRNISISEIIKTPEGGESFQFMMDFSIEYVTKEDVRHS